jgi:hemerythrin
MALLWTRELSVGIAEIDEQHRELFRRVDALQDAVGVGASRERAAEALAFLEVYVVRHFRDEEALMIASRYAGLPEQRSAHRRFVGTFDRLRSTLARRGPSRELLAEVRFRTTAWLVNHVCGLDRRFADFLRAPRDE